MKRFVMIVFLVCFAVPFITSQGGGGEPSKSYTPSGPPCDYPYGFCREG